MSSRFWASEAERTRDRDRLDSLAETILDEVPGAALASNQSCRVADLAIDFFDDVAPLGSEVDAIFRLFATAGATAKASSIYIDGWFGSSDKLEMARARLTEELNDRILFVGDSTNDEPMFATFPLSFRVANVLRFAHRIQHMLRFIAARGSSLLDLPSLPERHPA